MPDFLKSAKLLLINSVALFNKLPWLVSKTFPNLSAQEFSVFVISLKNNLKIKLNFIYFLKTF